MYIKTMASMLFKFLLVALGIVFISSLIGLFHNGINLDLKQYVENVLKVIVSLIHYNDLTITNERNNTYPMFPTFWEAYFYSMVIFLSAVVLSVIIGIVLAYVVYLLPSKWSKFIMKASSLMESTPDLFILIVIQYVVIFTFKHTGVLLFPIVGAQEKVFLVPILTLSILPSILVFRIIFLLINDELTKTYVSLVKSKGFSKHYIFFIHILRNISFSLLNHSKTIILFILSSLIVFERLFNIYGITHFIIAFPQMEVISFSLILFYLPVFVLLFIVRMVLERTTGQKVVI